MKTEIKRLSQCKVRLYVTCEKEIVKEALNEAKSNTSEEKTVESALDLLVKKTYPQAVEQNELPVISTPFVDCPAVVLDENKEFTYSCEVEVYPDIVLGEYKGIVVAKQSVSISDDDVNAYVDEEIEQHVSWEEVDRDLQEGDTAVFDFVGSIDGVAFEGGAAQNYELVIGSRQFIPGFEDQMVGMKKGEQKDVVVTFPQEYHAKELAGKEAVFAVSLHQIKQSVYPSLSDEFVSSLALPDVTTVEDYLSYARQSLTKEAEKRAEDLFTNEILKTVCQNATADIPNCFIERAAQNHGKQFEETANSYGISVEALLQAIGTTVEEFEQQLRLQAKAEVLRDLVLGKIARVENIAPSKEEIEEGYRLVAASSEETVEQVKEQISEQQLTDQLTALLTIQFLKNNVTIQEV